MPPCTAAGSAVMTSPAAWSGGCPETCHPGPESCPSASGRPPSKCTWTGSRLVLGSDSPRAGGRNGRPFITGRSGRRITPKPSTSALPVIGRDAWASAGLRAGTGFPGGAVAAHDHGIAVGPRWCSRPPRHFVLRRHVAEDGAGRGRAGHPPPCRAVPARDKGLARPAGEGACIADRPRAASGGSGRIDEEAGASPARAGHPPPFHRSIRCRLPPVKPTADELRGEFADTLNRNRRRPFVAWRPRADDLVHRVTK
jgi:hypothetical protein